MQFKKLTFFVICTTLLFSGCDSKVQSSELEVVQNKEQSKFTLKTTNLKDIIIDKKDDKMTFKGLENKMVLLNFWATWCPPCKSEIPHLNNLQNKYKNDFEVLAISLGQKDGNITPEEEMSKFINDYNIKYHVTNIQENFELSKAMGEIKIIPTMFLFNKEGKMVQKYVGVVPEEMLELDIKRALGK